jgi:purine-binding chemotaxis protein CheW
MIALAGSLAVGAAEQEYVTFRVGEQWLGIPVLTVQEVLTAQRIASVPLTPSDVAGFLNLRGRIVTAVDLRERLGMSARDTDVAPLNVVVRDGEELFSFLVDEVGDVLAVATEAVEPAPATLAPVWKACCDGIVRREKGLLVVVNATVLLSMDVAASPNSGR